MRVCFGEFDWPDERGRREFLQVLFLSAIESQQPDVLDDLFDKAFETYQRTAAGCLDWHSLAVKSEVRLRVEAWGQTWNLTALWCLNTALASLHFWTIASNKPKPLYFQHPGGGGVVPARPPVPAGLKEYVPHCMFKEDYLENVRLSAKRAFQEAIRANSLLSLGKPNKAGHFIDSVLDAAEEYCREVEERYVACNWSRCLQNERRNLAEHLGWLVRFQVCGHSFNQIAESENIEQSSVSRAVRELLDDLPLDKRPNSGPGRRLGQKESPQAKIRRKLGR